MATDLYRAVYRAGLTDLHQHKMKTCRCRYQYIKQCKFMASIQQSVKRYLIGNKVQQKQMLMHYFTIVSLTNTIVKSRTVLNDKKKIIIKILEDPLYCFLHKENVQHVLNSPLEWYWITPAVKSYKSQYKNKSQNKKDWFGIIHVFKGLSFLISLSHLGQNNSTQLHIKNKNPNIF